MGEFFSLYLLFFLNIHLGATDHSFEIALSHPEWQKTTSRRSNSQVYIPCFTKTKTLRRAVNPRPGLISDWPWARYKTPTRAPLLACTAELLHGHRLYTAQRQTSKVNSQFTAWPNVAWQAIDLRLNTTCRCRWSTRDMVLIFFLQTSQKGNLSCLPDKQKGVSRNIANVKGWTILVR